MSVEPTPNSNSYEPAITSKELSQRLGLTERTLARYRKEGMPTLQHNRTIRYLWSRVTAWLESK